MRLRPSSVDLGRVKGQISDKRVTITARLTLWQSALLMEVPSSRRWSWCSGDVEGQHALGGAYKPTWSVILMARTQLSRQHGRDET